MTKVRNVLGLVAGALLIVSSGAHSLVGWPVQGGELAKTGAPAELVTGLEVGWKFGGGAMLCFGVIVVATFVKRLRGERVSRLPAALIAVSYLAFAAWAGYKTNFDPFIFLFIIPGVLLAIAASGE